MPQAPSYMAPGSELELANQQTQRQRMLADMLRKQSMDPLQGQMAGQMYVPPSWTQGLAKLLQGYTARKHDEAADTTMQQARSAYDGRNKASTQELVAALSGTPAEKAPQDTAQFGADMSTPEQPPDINKALAVALGNQENPMMAGFGGKILESKLGSMLPKAPEWTLGERFNKETGKPEKFMYNKNNPAQEMPVGGQQATKLEFVNGQGVNPYNATPQGQAIPKQADAANPAKDLLVPGPDGKLVPNDPLISIEERLKKAGANSITQSVNTGQKGFDNTLKLRSDFRSEPIYKAHQDVQSAHSQITSALKQESPAGDMAGATKLMKILDPGSVVRESELGMAMAASGLLDRIQNYAQMVMSGTKLTPTQRKDFQSLADTLFAESAKQYNAKRGEYKGIADRNELNAIDVVGTEVALPKANAAKPVAPSGPAKISSDAEYNALPSGSTFVGPDGKTRRKP